MAQRGSAEPSAPRMVAGQRVSESLPGPARPRGEVVHTSCCSPRGVHHPAHPVRCTGPRVRGRRSKPAESRGRRLARSAHCGRRCTSNAAKAPPADRCCGATVAGSRRRHRCTGSSASTSRRCSKTLACARPMASATHGMSSAPSKTTCLAESWMRVSAAFDAVRAASSVWWLFRASDGASAPHARRGAPQTRQHIWSIACCQRYRTANGYGRFP